MLGDRLIGNRSRLPFIPLLSLRSQILFRRFPTALTILALAMSVALAASVEMSSRSVRTAVNKTADALVGDADLEVTAGDQGISESLAEAIRSVRHVDRASPSIQQTFRVAGGPAEGEAIRMIGIDFLQDRDVRDFSVFEEGVVVSDPLRLIAGPNAILVPRAMAQRLHLAEGSTLLLRGPFETEDFVVRGLLKGELTEAFGGQIAVMDVYALQALTRMGGRIHRIDVAVAEGADTALVQREIESIVGAGIAVRPPSLRQELRHSTMGVINVSIWSLVLIATLLSLLSTYAVVSLSVERRLEELALLRVAGMDGRRIALLIITDALFFAIVSTAIGLVIALFVADPLVSLLSQASQNLQRLRIDPLGLEPRTVAVAMLVGLPVAFFASLEPAIRVSRGSPIEALAGQRYAEYRSNLKAPLVAVSVIAAGLSAGAWLWRDGLTPGTRLAAIFGFSILSLGFGAGQLFAFAVPRLRGILGATIPRVGHLVASMLMERTLETGMTVAVWAALVGGVVSMVTTIESITASMDEYYSGWPGPSAFVAFAEDPMSKSTKDRDRVRAPAIEAMRAAPDVEAVAAFYDVWIKFRDTQLIVWSVDTKALLEHGGMDHVFEDREATASSLERGEAIVSHVFARRFQLKVGDEIEIETQRGPRTIRIGGLLHTYLGSVGAMTIDEKVFRAWFDTSSGASFAAFWTERESASTFAVIRERTREQPLFFLDSAAYRTLTSRIVSRYRALLLLPVILLGTAGTVVLLNLLLGNVLARRNDFAILRSAGGTAGNVVGIVLSNGAVIGLAGTAIGLPLAAYWSLATTEAIFDSYGWMVQFRLDWNPIVVAVVLAGFASVIAGIAPALLGRRQVPVGSILGS